MAALCEALSGADKVLSREPSGREDGYMACEARLELDVEGGFEEIESESLRGDGGNELRSGAMAAEKPTDTDALYGKS